MRFAANLPSRLVAVVVPIMVVALSSPAPRGLAAEPFVAHEWGTFSTFSGSDGIALKFTPNDTDLPGFVHRRGSYIKGGLTDALVSLETPVLYFYTDRDRTVSVRADFPNGVMTDWYPTASRPPTQQLRWDDLRVLAKDRPGIPVGTGRYFEARAVDAAFVKATDEKGIVQAERFLFYRGVGDAAMPVTLRAKGQGTFVVVNSGHRAVTTAFLLDVNDRASVRFRSLGRLEPGTHREAVLSPGETAIRDVADSVVKALVGRGLYENEARAMVKTWQSDWFGDTGTRVIYFVDEETTDALLPLSIVPKPDRLVRVLVGRHDVLTPEREREVESLVTQLNGDSNAAARSADAALKQFGRYRAAAEAAAAKRLAANRR